MTHIIKAILVPVDVNEPCEEAIRWAIDLARATRARIVFQHVVAPVTARPNPYAAYYSTIDVDQRTEALVSERLARLADRVIQSGVAQATTEVSYGDAAHEITEFAAREGVDLIMLGTHGRRGLSRLVLGSVAEKVVREARCPVFVAKTHQTIHVKERAAERETEISGSRSAQDVESKQVPGWVVSPGIVH